MLTLSRRRVCAIGLAGAISAAAPRANATAGTNLQRFIKMRGALDSRLVIGFTSGQYQGVVNGDKKGLIPAKVRNAT